MIGDSGFLWEILEDSFWIVQTGLNDPDVAGLTGAQRKLASLLLVWAGIENGGFSEPIVNSGGNWLPEACRAAEMIGADDLAKKLAGIVGLFDCSESEFVVRSFRSALSESLTDGQWASIEGDTNQFLGWYRRAEEYVRSNLGQF